MNRSDPMTCLPSPNDTRQIALTRGYFATVPASEYERISVIQWYPLIAYKPDGTIKTVYAMGIVDPANGRKLVYLHRFLMNVTDPKIQVDHIDGDGLNNDFLNLRTSTPGQNAHNARLRIDNTSGFKGVCLDKERWKWIVFVRFENHQRYLGRFEIDDIVGAARAHDAGALKYYGDRACTNVKLGLLPPLD